MTEIPGGFPKKVCPETFVSNHTGPIRIAEDQMQRLLECIHGVNLRSEPKPKPGQVKVSGEGWVGPYDKDDYIRTLETQIKCLQSNLDAANDRAMLARKENEELKAHMPKYTDTEKDWMAQLIEENERLKAQIPNGRYSVWIEMNPKTMRWNAFPCGRDGVMFDSTATKEETLLKCRDFGFEVVE